MNWFSLIIFVAIMYIAFSFLSPVFVKLAGKKRQIYSDKNPDVNKRMKAIRIRNAKIQKPKYVKRVVLNGDSKKNDCDLGKINGMLEDRRVMEISYKPSILSFSRLMLVPNFLLETSSLNKNLCIRANGVKPIALGLIDVPVLREEDVHLEDEVRRILSDYWAYILSTDLSYLVSERTFHNVTTAPGSSQLDSSVLLQAEREYMTQPEAEERL